MCVRVWVHVCVRDVCACVCDVCVTCVCVCMCVRATCVLSSGFPEGSQDGEVISVCRKKIKDNLLLKGLYLEI